MNKMNRTLIKLLNLSLLLILLLNHCGKTPSDPPAIPTGSLKISALIDTTMVDSMAVELNNNFLGMFPNPCVLTDLVIGRHQVALSKEDPADTLVDFNCSPKLVDINADDTTRIELLLTKLAPDFTLENLNHEQRALQDYRGKVVFLVFFSYT
jgi:hypothetical protein